MQAPAHGRLDRVEAIAAAARAHPTEAGAAYLDEIEGLIALSREEPDRAVESFDALVRAAADSGYPLVELRARIERAGASAAAGRSEEAAEMEARAQAIREKYVASQAVPG